VPFVPLVVPYTAYDKTDMKAKLYTTKSERKEDVVHAWWVIDAENVPLGRLATRVAHVLRGKHKPSYTPHVDCGDCVIVLNADKIRLTGNKMSDKVYLSHSGYPGGQRSITAAELLKKKPYAVVERAVKGMLPNTKLGSAMFRKLHVYAGDKHSHSAQKPQKLEL